MTGIESRQVAWWPVHEFVQSRIPTVTSWATVGTPSWCQLADDDPAKLAAVLDAGRRYALHLDVAQQELASASREIASAENWGTQARRIINQHRRIPRRAAS
jgi:hypothetical protein